MTALAQEAPVTMSEITTPEDTTPGPELEEVLWQAWKAMELPEGLHAEIIEGFIEVSPTGRFAHGQVANRLRRAIDKHLDEEEWAAYQDINVVHDRKVWIPDCFIAPEDPEAHVTDDGIGIKASAVQLIVEVVSPGHDGIERDRERKRRAYAGAGIPVYVLIDDYDGHGTVTVLAAPRPDEAVYTDVHRVAYGIDVIIPEGPAKGFVIGEAITGPPRNA
ncbi:Uma2 family endonuclease [Streptomyces platensis]|uniref:Uma2 family endonuclease n=1 Tax=Streptomyces platensis TaxID=58346 RepID=UPI002E81F358|nr:Uma2 family endonuclease [Streptomyces platensis]WTI54807.1 Uma2 family endonuclease [Streptomyces platensis]WUB79632.1 Uma2 family endonuclease [Streptomyces platensis]